MAIDGPTCAACGDPATRLWNKKPACAECYEELRFGVCRDPNVSEERKINESAATPDDISPWQENAIRSLEGD